MVLVNFIDLGTPILLPWIDFVVIIYESNFNSIIVVETVVPVSTAKLALLAFSLTDGTKNVWVVFSIVAVTCTYDDC